MYSLLRSLLVLVPGLLFAGPALASSGPIDLTTSTAGYIALAIFVLAYLLVMGG